jgi:hypothetical protein
MVSPSPIPPTRLLSDPPSVLSTHIERLSFLGAEAQDEAIAKYGIAGRVWYKLLSSVSYSLPPPTEDATGNRLMP